MKYHTMGDNEEIKEIELSSEFSQFERSQSSETGSNQRSPAHGLLSETSRIRRKSIPKLLKSAPERQMSSEELDIIVPLQTNFNSRYLKGHRRQTAETENSDSDMRSIRSRKHAQKEQLGTMMGFLLQFTWMIVYSLALSATGPLLIGLPGDNMFVLMAWKLQITLIVFLPLAYIELKYKPHKERHFQLKYVKKVFHIIFASVMYVIWFMGLLEACRNSIILHALLMNNLGILIMRKQAGILTKIGLGFGIIGVLILLYSSYSGH